MQPEELEAVDRSRDGAARYTLPADLGDHEGVALDDVSEALSIAEDEDRG